MRVTVTGGAGYVGACVVEELQAHGHDVRVLDVLLHGQEGVAAALEADGTEMIRGDVRDGAGRSTAPTRWCILRRSWVIPPAPATPRCRRR
jgi:nucleoside-diphosphate-sugar epimerase